MKYTVLGFQQDKALELKLGMNDLLLMRTIKDMYSSAGMEFIIEKGDKYMWANQNYLHKQVPIIGSKRTMLRIIDKLVELGLIERKLKHSKNGVGGNYFYVKPTVKMDKLQDYEPYDKMSEPKDEVATPYDKVSKGSRQNVNRSMTEWHNKDTSLRDTSNKDTSKDTVVANATTDTDNNKLNTPHEKIKDLYNKTCGDTLPRVIALNDKRKQRMRTLWKFVEQDIDMIEQLFTKAVESDFLSGRNGVWGNCNFDWLINQNNAIKVLEDTYKNKGGQNGGSKRGTEKDTAKDRQYEESPAERAGIISF